MSNRALANRALANRARAIVALLGAATLAACSPGTDLPISTPDITFVADPTAVLIKAGQTTTVVVNSVPTTGTNGTVKWTTSDAKVVTVDDKVDLGAPATIRAVAPGTASLSGIVSITGLQSTVSVQVRVTTGP